MMSPLDLVGWQKSTMGKRSRRLEKGRSKRREKSPVSAAGSSIITDLPASSNTRSSTGQRHAAFLESYPPHDVDCAANSTGSDQADHEQQLSTSNRQGYASSLERATSAATHDEIGQDSTSSMETPGSIMQHVPSTPSNDDRNIRPGAYHVGGLSSRHVDDEADVANSDEEILQSEVAVIDQGLIFETVDDPLPAVVVDEEDPQEVNERWERTRRQYRIPGVPVSVDNDNSFSKKRIICCCSFLIAAAAGAVTGIVVGTTNKKEDGPVTPQVQPPTSAPVPATPAPTWPERCFSTRNELWEAVDHYLEDRSNSSNVAITYGWPIGTWCVSQIEDFSDVFSADRNVEMISFNEDISDWDTSSAASMARMFSESAFNGNLSLWDVSRVTDMLGMFSEANVFNQDLSSWNVSNVEEMQFMFSNAQGFNQGISSWNISKVTNTESMFSLATSFNQDISSWNVSKVTNMESMFSFATSFNQNLCAWGETIIMSARVTEMFNDSACSTEAAPDLLGDPKGPFCAECT